jgi:peptidoglycan hydrolase-like protein with peptidoglycan-binding domain
MKGLQAALLALGFRIAVDGTYGAETRAAIEAFQAHAGLAADGIAGNATDAAILEALAALS